MSIINKNDILKVLISYNPWWKTNEVPTDTIKDMKRTAFYEAKKAFNNKDVGIARSFLLDLMTKD